MRSYKEYRKKMIGYSDISALIMAGGSDDGLKVEELSFGGDGLYYAYMLDGEAKIPEHYELVAEFKNHLKIYDDDKLTISMRSYKIRVYRAGDFGCIIQQL